MASSIVATHASLTWLKEDHFEPTLAHARLCCSHEALILSMERLFMPQMNISDDVVFVLSEWLV
jgi:hypothetical protein